jgi:hypothetical protein
MFVGDTSDPWSVIQAESDTGCQRVMKRFTEVSRTALPDETSISPADDGLMKELSKLTKGERSSLGTT